LLPADEITLKNGDRVTGKIVKKDGDKVTIKSDLMGDGHDTVATQSLR